MNVPKKPLQIGVTGGIGSGKSTVCRIFSCLGIPVYEADSRARWLTNHDPVIRKEVVALLGDESFTADGTYNRKYVASRVFSDALLLQKLNQIIHPRVLADSNHWLQLHVSHPYVIREAALMNRAGEGNLLDKVLVVTAPLSLRINRIKWRDPQRSVEEIEAIVKNQISDEERLTLADHVVDNGEDVALIPQVLALHKILLGLTN
ncbi:dephospho-CoA kinase [Persicitalea jodogahamensis]|uniref:Dephospho-CoA kinase n=1 Tax=Persicitalea jodogahamensis TaxID=402147 RepID=A0A8J3DAS9_9BACT|nr:dephospho-CoA kinase [Persicitalea jodogahamensis]GHB77096.1 dephospho-CoA kinase [Persicitalea jodogahamensis]